MRKKLLQLVICFLAFSVSALAQNKTITGTVSDEKGNPVTGISVTARGTKLGTTTGVDGSFSLTIPSTVKTLTVSGVGYGTQTVDVTDRSSVSVKLKTEDGRLEEVIVTGYGTQKRKDVTASISTIGAGQIKDVPVQSFEQALAGKATGLNVTMPNGVLGNPPVIRIRGSNSITGSTFPLVIVDGVPISSGDASTNLAANNALGGVNPSDIEDIQVLKDAAATAIFGSRGTNGVLLITTKKGKSGKARVSYDFWYGTTKAFNIFNVLGAVDYVTIKNEAIRNGNNSPVSATPSQAPAFFLDTINGKLVDTRWADEIFQTGVQQNHAISISGANAGTRYYFGGNYSKQDGILQTNSFDRKQMRMNIEQKVNNWLKIGANVNFTRTTTNAPNSGSLPGTPFSTAGSARLAFVTAPNVSPYAADGRYNIIGIDDPVQRNSFNQIGRNKNLDRSGFYNPAMVRDLNKISSQSDQFLGDLNAEITIIKGLKFRTQYGVNYQSVEDKTFYNSLHGDGIQTTATTDDGTAFNAIGKYNTTNFQNYFTYEFDFNKEHNFYITLGHEETATNSDRWSGKRSGLSDQFFNEFQGNFTINDNPNSNVITENYLLSYFGRVNYNFKNKYYLSANVRQDEYSAFAPGKKRGVFYGGSLGWTISEEGFWKGDISKTINLLKLRGSYGTLGNITSVGNFASLSTFGSFQYGNGLPTLFFSQAGNQDLQWESSNKMDIGLQFEMFKGRLRAEVTYYEAKLKDLIIDVPTPTSLGIPGNSIAANAAQMYNKGIELSISGEIISKKDFTWTATLNYTTVDNQVTALATGVPEIVGTTQLERTNITRVGAQLGSFYLLRTLGVDPATGRRIFQNAAGQKVFFDFSVPAAQRWKFEDGTIAPAIDLGKDGYIAGNSTPTFFGGITNSFSYKGFDLLVDAIFSGGNKIYFGSRAGMLDQRFWNNTTDVLRRWTKPGDVTDIPRVVYNDNISNGSAAPIDANLFDGSYIKFRTISLGYTFPKSTMDKIGLSSLRVYSSILNAFTITNYPGSDPEVSVNGNNALTPGVDRNTIGQARTFTFGLNVGF